MAIVYSGDNITFGDGSIIAGVATQNNVYNVVTANANTGVGNTTVTFTSNTAAINVGMIIYGAGFGYGTRVSSLVNANTIVVSSAAANTATNTKISFVEPNRVVTADVAGPGLCKAWVLFNGIGTVAIRGAFNVSSVTDLGTGNYRINFTQAMSDDNYSAVCGTPSHNTRVPSSGSKTASYADILCNNSANAANDVDNISVAIFR